MHGGPLRHLLICRAIRQTRTDAYRTAVRRLQCLSVQLYLGAEIKAERILQFYLHLLFLGKVFLRIILRSQVPFCYESADVLRLGAHAEIHHQALAAGIHRGDDPVMPRPIKLPIQSDLCPGTVFPQMSPEIPLKVDLPLGSSRFDSAAIKCVIHNSLSDLRFAGLSCRITSM